jgi:ABC-2 type transport system ATP-binding protein
LHKGRPIVHGSLKEIKHAFGRKNLVIHADFSLDSLKSFPGVVKSKLTMEGIHLQIEGEYIAEKILKEIVDKGFIRRFALDEPSLNDIFIEKVGNSYE